MSVRRAVAVVVLTAWVVAATGAPALAAPAPTPSAGTAPEGRFIELTPSTVEPGYLVGIRASCTDADDDPPEDTEAALVQSTLFDDVTVEPQFGILTGTVTVPSDAGARSYRVALNCPGIFGGEEDATLNVVGGNRPSRGPATGFGGTAGDDDSTLVLTSGVIALAAGVVLGIVTLRRRRTT